MIDNMFFVKSLNPPIEGATEINLVLFNSGNKSDMGHSTDNGLWLITL